MLYIVYRVKGKDNTYYVYDQGNGQAQTVRQQIKAYVRTKNIFLGNRFTLINSETRYAKKNSRV